MSSVILIRAFVRLAEDLMITDLLLKHPVDASFEASNDWAYDVQQCSFIGNAWLKSVCYRPHNSSHSAAAKKLTSFEEMGRCLQTFMFSSKTVLKELNTSDCYLYPFKFGCDALGWLESAVSPQNLVKSSRAQVFTMIVLICILTRMINLPLTADSALVSRQLASKVSVF